MTFSNVAAGVAFCHSREGNLRCSLDIIWQTNQGTPNRHLPPPVLARLPPALTQQHHLADHNAFIQRLRHVVDGQLFFL